MTPVTMHALFKVKSNESLKGKTITTEFEIIIFDLTKAIKNICKKKQLLILLLLFVYI